VGPGLTLDLDQQDPRVENRAPEGQQQLGTSQYRPPPARARRLIPATIIGTVAVRMTMSGTTL
jgi:hypothetical protein